MSITFRVVSIDDSLSTLVIDWGFVTLTHDIPLIVLENPGMSKSEVAAHLGYMRPEPPVRLPVPDALMELVGVDWTN